METNNEEIKTIETTEPERNETDPHAEGKAWDRFIRNTAIFLSSAE